MSERLRNILLVGGGACEDALGRKINQEVAQIHVAPGNTGIQHRGGRATEIDPLDFDRLERYAHDHKIDLTVVGPEEPLSQGIVDVFQGSGLNIFGPTQEAARLGVDRQWQEAFLSRHPEIARIERSQLDADDRELSVTALTDGLTIVPLMTHEDYEEMNTTVGTYGSIQLQPRTLACIQEDILQPTIDALSDEEATFTGLLETKIALTDEGPKAIDFGITFADPATQALAMLMESNMVQALYAATNETVDEDMIKLRRKKAVCVVVSADQKRAKIRSMRFHVANPNITVFHEDTQYLNGNFYTTGERAFTVTGVGDTYHGARINAYTGIGEPGPSFPGMKHPKDVALDAHDEE